MKCMKIENTVGSGCIYWCTTSTVNITNVLVSNSTVASNRFDGKCALSVAIGGI